MPPRRRVTSGSRESQDGLPIKEEEEGVSDWTERMAEAVPASAVPIYHEATWVASVSLLVSVCGGWDAMVATNMGRELRI
jgi:hypothetical protein